MPNVHKPKTDDPKARGGRRNSTPAQIEAVKSLKKHSWQKGQSGNPTGRPTSLMQVMRTAREYAPEVLEKMIAIIRDPKAMHRDVIQAGLAIWERGLGKSLTGEQAHALTEGASGCGDTSVLLQAAGATDAAAYRQALRNELARLDAMDAQNRSDREDALNQARRARANGQRLPAPLAALLEMKDAKE